MRGALPALWLGALAAVHAAQGGTLLDPKVRDLLHEELSGEVAKEHVIAITRHHRIQGSRGYRDAAQWVLAKLRQYGFDEEHAWIESFPSDGKVHYQTWQAPSGWHIDSAELRLVEPSTQAGGERIVGYPEIAMSVVTYSNPGDVTAELVWVGSGEADGDYAGKDVKGKLVLATGYGGAVHRLAVLEHGAAAVVCYLDDERAREYPDMLQYTGMWPKPDELERTTFGFNLTNRQGERLRALLEAGKKVVLRGTVEGPGLEPFAMDVVVAKIDGSARPDEELLFSAHLDHPKESANDNASGSGAILDIARGLTRLIADGRLPRPARTLRFLWVPEWHGTMAYVDAHPELLGATWERGGTVLANMNLDMVGENTELLHSKLILTRNPLSIPNVVDAVVADMAAMVDALDVRTPRGSLSAFNYRHVPYSGGSDHMMFIDRGIPSVMFSHEPDYTHHTSEDTPDKVDPVQLERCEILATGALWFLANLSEEEALDLAWLAAERSAASVAAQARRMRGWLVAATPQERTELLPEAEAALAVQGRLEERALRSVLAHFDPRDPGASPALARAIEAHRAAIGDLVEAALQSVLGEALPRGVDATLRPSARPLHGNERRVARQTRGPLAFDVPERMLPAERAAWYRADDFPFDGTQRFELVNLANTGATLAEIEHFFAAEFDPPPAGTVVRFFEDLESVGLVALDAAGSAPATGEKRSGR